MLGMTGRNHKNVIKRRGADDSVDDRETPPDVYDPLNLEFSFTLDVAAARHNSKCKRYFALGPNPVFDPRQLQLFEEPFIGDVEAEAIDGLRQDWEPGERIWCNPPYSDIEPWVRKATYCLATVVMLLPSTRTEQPWWQQYIEPWRDGRSSNMLLDARFLAGRRNFRNRGAEIMNRTSRNPPFGLVVLVWDRRN